MIFGLLSIGITVAAGYLGHSMARNYTASRLKFVDAVQKPSAAWIAGFAAFGVGMLLTPLPLITAATAIVLGAGVGTGVATGARQSRGYLPPG
jgi:hypothetical protein